MRVKDPAAIRRWRKQRHFSQDELAFLVRRSQSTIHLLESGRMKTLSEDLAVAIAARLEVPWDELFDLEREKNLPHITSSELTANRIKDS
ncbi:helix-turn-helix transcriptional regulator [Auritidibacter ignavus]|uniref:helix-turn-helix transcriptional regulator n=1 Tax=Auritidibacter ignavus TaxID=678932 RepID=UPI00244705FE|nr:helix-turn-helix transcriptional regulator [Auritidibacter ignavus]WGH80622.1 helix-turn-helix transcriptional regulator [Auritidibacter ignavus]